MYDELMSPGTLAVAAAIYAVAVIVGLWILSRCRPKNDGGPDDDPTELDLNIVPGMESFHKPFSRGSDDGSVDLVRKARKTNEVVAISETKEGQEWADIEIGLCPACGSKDGFWESPNVTTLSTKVTCIHCRSKFIVTPVIGIAQRVES